MNLRNLFRISAAVSMIIGLVWLVAPKVMPASYGQDLDPYGAYILQQVGGINVALAILYLLVSGLPHSPARQAVVTFAFVSQVLSGIVTLIAVLNGAIPPTAGWLGLAISFVFALAFGYFGFMRPESNLAVEEQT